MSPQHDQRPPGGAAPAEPAAPHGKRRPGRQIGMAVYAVVAAVSITAATVFSFQSASAGNDLRAALTVIAPAGVGGGWDSFAREQQQAMRGAGIVNSVQVVNIPGAGGTIGLSTFSTMHGQANTIMATGAVMLGGIALNDSPVDLSDTRPIARIAEDYNALVVSADAPYDSMEDLIAAWSEDPDGIVWTGGSAGSIDHLIIAQLALDQDLPASEITFIPKSGGGEAIQTLLAGTTDVAVTGYNEVEDQIAAGRVKALAVSSPERLEGVDIPTLIELGYAVDLVNWRGLLAPPGITDEEFAELEAIVAEARESAEWQESLQRNRWEDSFLTGPELLEFIDEDQARTTALIEELGL